MLYPFRHLTRSNWPFHSLQRNLSRWLGLLLVGLLLSLWIMPWSLAQVRANNQEEIRGVWLTSNDTVMMRDQTRLQGAIDQLARLNLNTLYPVVWNSGYALYPSAVAQRAGIQPFVQRGNQGQDPLTDLIAQARQRGMRVIPWFEFGFMTPPTSELAMDRAEWLTQKRNGSQTSVTAAGEVVWLNPFRPEVQKFITDLVLEIVSQYDVDGIQLDDHTSLPSEFGYDPFTLALYKQETKKDAPTDFQNPEWVRWRANKLTAFIAQLNRAIKARKPGAIVSLSPAPYDFAYKAQLQDWLDWVRKNLVDELIVQIYRYDLQPFINQINRPELLESRQKIPTAAGVLTGLRTRPVPLNLIRAKVQAARERGLGVVFFYYETLWSYATESQSERQLGLQGLFP